MVFPPSTNLTQTEFIRLRSRGDEDPARELEIIVFTLAGLAQPEMLSPIKITAQTRLIDR